MITAIEDVVRNPSQAERLDRLEEKRDESSERLNLRIDELTRRFEASASRPLEVDNIRFPPRVVAAIVFAVASIIGGMWASTYGLRSDVRDILTRTETKERLDELNRKITDQQTETITKAVDVIDKRQQLQAIQIQELKEMVLKQGVGK